MKTAMCPKCFTVSGDEQFVYACPREGCKSHSKPLGAAEAVRDRNGQPACPCCGEPYPHPLCPECGFPILDSDADSLSLSISLVGSQGSGKSHYLSVLIDELKNSVSPAYSCSLFPLGGDDTLSLYEKQYYRRLFVDNQCLASTAQDEVSPLIYSLVFQNETRSKSVNLMFYDSCGANFETITAMANHNRSVYHAGGILFMIDPTQVPAVAEWQASRGGRICDSDAGALLTRIVHLVRTGSGQKNLGKKLDIPIAVCLTKLDTLRPMLDAASFLRAPSRHLREGSFDSDDFEACSLEAQSLIEFWGGGELVRQVNTQFANVGFFGVSSLGGEPSESGGVHHIAPHRVTDPLLWLLWKCKAIS
jgi:hypothetical protein